MDRPDTTAAATLAARFVGSIGGM